MITRRLEKNGLVLLYAVFLLAGAASDTLGGPDPLPPPGAYFSAYVADSATSQPLAGADLNIRNPQAYYSMTRTDSGGWAHVSRDALPYHGTNPIQVQWVTAAYPGYVAQMANCEIGDSASRVLRFTLSRATTKNSITFTGILIDSATLAPIPRITLDLSHSEKGGWMTYVATTDDSGKFDFTGIPIGRTSATFWVRKPNGKESFFPVSLAQEGKPIIVSGFTPTSIASPRILRTAADRGKSPTIFPFGSRKRDMAGRLRH